MTDIRGLDMNSDMFGVSAKAEAKRIDVLPVSVVDVAAQLKSGKREIGGHDANSSRQEYSNFPYEVASLCFDLFLRDANSIFDPFAGWGERHAFALKYGKKYIGYDTSEEAIKRADDVYGVKNILADSGSNEIPKFNGMITCPPYWNLERYEGEGIDSCPTWESFKHEYENILKRCYAAASSGTTFCIMACDWRSGGVYYPLCHVTRNAMLACGATMFDEVIVSRKSITKIKVMIPQAVENGYTVKVHETLMVFRK